MAEDTRQAVALAMGDFLVRGFDPTTDHKAALAFAKEYKGSELAMPAG
jgi:hypothetical protein